MILIKKLFKILFAFSFWILIWDIVCYFFVKDLSILPSSLMIAKNTLDLMFRSDMIWLNLWHSSYRFLIAASLSLPIGYCFALLMCRNHLLKWIFEPFIYLTFPLPKVALFPFIILMMGLGDISKIFLIAISIFYLVFISTYQSVKNLLTSSLIDIVKIYEIKGVNFWYYYLIKGTWPSFLTGARAGLGYGVTVVVVSEWTLSNNGIGYFIWSSWEQYRVLDMYTGILFLGLIGYIIQLSLQGLENREENKYK